MLRPISEVAVALHSTKNLQISPEILPLGVFEMWNWANAESIFSNNYFFSKKYTNKFIDNVGQYVTKATFSETTEDRGRKHI